MSAIPSYQAVLQQLMTRPAPTPSAGLDKAMFGGGSAVNAFAAAQDTANNANFQRGQSILSLLAAQGQSAKQSNTDLFKQQSAQIEQSAIGRGLSNTTVVPNLLQGANTELMKRNNAVDEASAGNLAGMLASFQDKGPDPNLMASLLSQANSAPKAPRPTSTIISSPTGMGSKVQIDSDGNYVDPFTGIKLRYTG